ncbi:MAG: hypothetical protein JXA67_09265 [Micromonosporaceae bacterium]|nr:hypothetical protein [Micromonosporaceae bacterium]
MTLTLDPDVLAGAKALAEAEGVPLSTWLAAKVRQEVRAHNARAYATWWGQNSNSHPETVAFDQAVAGTTSSSWTGSEW